MKLVHQFDMKPGTIQGEYGSVDTYDIERDGIVAGIRIIRPNSNVPRRPHSHPERQIIYLISGVASITNGREEFTLKPGDFVLLESDEEHYVITTEHEAVVFEVKYP
ncbi:MAG: cupin domain-containing protein [Candidatus Thorarchaeota archaeon]